jgi:hypothetical protein
VPSIEHASGDLGPVAWEDLQAIQSQLDSPVRTINELLNTSFVATLGEGGHGATSYRGGVILVDISAARRLDASELLVLVAHEVGHALHSRSTNLEGSPNRSLSVYDELGADEFSGWVAGRLSYADDLLERVFRKARLTSSGRESSSANVILERRLAAFRRGFKAGAFAASRTGKDASGIACPPEIGVNPKWEALDR